MITAPCDRNEEVLGLGRLIKVANKSDLESGNGLCIEIDGRAIAVFNVNGEYFALDNTCIHRGGPLGEGFVDTVNCTVQCPWHGWIYSLQTGEATFNPGSKVEKFAVLVEGEDIKVEFD